MRKLSTLITPEVLRSQAVREAPRIAAYGWRPSASDLAELRASTRDAATYKIYLRAWRRGGFPLRAAKRLAGRAVRP
jgi:hypothetical protein